MLMHMASQLMSYFFLCLFVCLSDFHSSISFLVLVFFPQYLIIPFFPFSVRNYIGEILIGKLLEDLDALAGNIAFLHCDDNNPDTRSLHVVTAAVDTIKMVP
jgi:hypothetical protein